MEGRTLKDSIMSDWDDTEESNTTEQDSTRYSFGLSSLPKAALKRKRTSAAAGLVDDFADDFERRLKLTPSSKERLKVADWHLKDPRFVRLIMRSLPEYCLRKLAVTCSEWRDLAYSIIRERRGNNAFSVFWLENEAYLTMRDENHETDLDFSRLFHPAYIGGYSDVSKLNQIKTGAFALAAIDNNCQNNNFKPICLGASHEIQRPELPVPDQKIVDFILTYGNDNMEPDVLAAGKYESLNSQTSYSTLLTLSSSIVITTPDGNEVIDIIAADEAKLISSVMFPSCSHVTMECFLVPSNLSESYCYSNVIGVPSPNKQPKVLLLYQYFNLSDCEPGLVEVLQSLKTTQGSSGFPMVTGIYTFIDASLSNSDSSRSASLDPVATGLLISGDEYCSVALVSVNLTNSPEYIVKTLDEVKLFYETNAFSTKLALLFYHNEAAKNPDSRPSFSYFLSCFQSRLPNVHIHGIGSLSGAHEMFVHPDPNSNASFNQLNVNMKELSSGTSGAKTSLETFKLMLVLLTYQGD